MQVDLKYSIACKMLRTPDEDYLFMPTGPYFHLHVEGVYM